MNALPPTDLVISDDIATRPVRRWTEALGRTTGHPLGDKLRFENGNSTFAILFPQGVPDGFHEREYATSAVIRCLRIVAATRRTTEATHLRLKEDLLDVAHHAWAVATAADPSLRVDRVEAMTATPWSKARVVGSRDGSRDVVDLTPEAWIANSPRIVRIATYRTGMPGNWAIAPSSSFAVNRADPLDTLRRSARGCIACTPEHRWTMPGDEIWRKASDARRIRR